MNERPAPPPEGQLITAALAKVRPKLTLRDAARRADISEARWRQIAQGYVMVSGKPSAVIGPPETIARMAKAVGVTAAELTAAGREDAALELRVLEAEAKHGDKTNEEILDRNEYLAKEVWAALQIDGHGWDDRQRREVDRWVRGLVQVVTDYESDHDDD